MDNSRTIKLNFNILQNRKESALIGEITILTLILGVGAYLRFYHLAQVPGWYSDEGTVIDIAKHLLKGEIQYFAIQKSTLLVARLPLFPTILAILFNVAGTGIRQLRLFTSSLGVLSTGLIYLVVRQLFGRKGLFLALTSALIYAIYPKAILYNRLGFGYNLLIPFMLLGLLFIGTYLKDARIKWAILASFFIGLGTITEVIFWVYIPILIVLISIKNRKHLIWCILVLSSPLVIYILFSLIKSPNEFMFDLQFTLLRLKEIPLLAQPVVILMNYGLLVVQDLWIAIGIFGLLLLRDRKFQSLLLMFFFVPMIGLMRSATVVGLGFYYFTPLLPFIAIGMANVILRLVNSIFEFSSWVVDRLIVNIKILQRETKIISWISAIVSSSCLLLIVTPIVTQPILLRFQMDHQWDTGINWVLVNPADATETASYVNSHVFSDDLVISSPATAWMYNSNVSDFQVSLAAEGKPTKHFPTNIPDSRFRYDPRLDNAKYVVIDPIWRNWAASNIPAVAKMMFNVESWPLVFQSGELSVYRNPNLN